MYKLYENPMDRLKESLGLTRKKRYKEHYALNNVSFQVKKGETVGIIGTNGSGKSTILKIITGVLNPTHREKWWWMEESPRCWNWEPDSTESIPVSKTCI